MFDPIPHLGGRRPYAALTKNPAESSAQTAVTTKAPLSAAPTATAADATAAQSEKTTFALTDGGSAQAGRFALELASSSATVRACSTSG